MSKQTATTATHLLAIDQGTTSSRAIIYRQDLEPIASAQHEFTQSFPKDGWVEHDAEEIWQTTLASTREALKKTNLDATQIAALGITNQRETTVLWDKRTGKPLAPAIVWQDRRTADYCAELKQDGHEAMVQERTGLLLDPYFSGTKLAWLLKHIDGARERAERGELAFGTIDCFLLWKLTRGKVHATDASNASRTLLMNLATRDWDDELLRLFDIPRALLPEIRDNASDFGVTHPELFGSSIAIAAMIGDQQAALVGQACIKPGMLKSTYGTGCFALVNCGEEVVRSEHRLLTTLAYQLDGKPCYALEGSIFMAGAIVQWLRDKLGIIQTAAESEGLARGVDYQQTEIMVPAFTGLGAPYWDPNARAAIIGMTRDTTRKQITAAALRSVAYQSKDLLNAMASDGQQTERVRVDGGMTENDWFLQALADISGRPIERTTVAESTARGAAFLAGLQVGLYQQLADIEQFHRSDAEFTPQISAEQRRALYEKWLAAVTKVR